jgi:hypothetical protein
MGYMLAYNTGITIAEYYRQYREVAPIAKLIGACVAGFFFAGFALFSEDLGELVFIGLVFFYLELLSAITLFLVGLWAFL